jgi:high affinity sulfate transporter 1
MIPLLDTIKGYDRSWFSADLAAALTVWAIVVPESMAYASIAGMPPETGLYAASVPLIVYALFASSRRVTFGPSAAIAAISSATVVPLAGSDPDRVFALTVALSLVTGAVLLLAGWAKLGAIADFLSSPVLAGFLTGVGLSVAIGQVPKIMGVEIDSDEFFAEVVELFRAIPDIDVPTLIVGLVALALLLGLHRWIPKVPSALVVVVLSILAVGAFDLESRGVEVVGDIASGLPGLVIPDVGFEDLTALFGGALGLAVVVFGQTAALAKAFALPHRENVDANQEMRAIGAANIAGGLFGTFATVGSDSRTAAANAAGQESQVSTLIVGVFVLVTAAFLTGFFRDLPEAVLGAIVVHAAIGLVEFAPFKKLYRQNRGDFWAATATLLGVLIFEVLAGLLIGVFVSLGLLMARVVRPRVVELGWNETSGAFQGIDDGGAERVPGLRIIRFDAPIFFANVGVLQSNIDALLHDETTKAVIVDVDAGDDVDTTSAAAVSLTLERADEAGVSLVFARMHRTLREDLERGEVDLSGRVYRQVESAVDAYRRGELKRSSPDAASVEDGT